MRTRWTGEIQRVIAAYRDQDRWIAPNPISSPKALSTPPESAVRDPCSTLREARCRNGVGDTPKGQRRPVRPHDSWRTPTPFWKGRLFKEDVEIHWRRHTIKTAMKGRKAKRRGWFHSGRLDEHNATISSWRATKPFLTGRLYKVALAVHWSQKAMRSPFQWFKRRDSVGATPKGQSRPG